MRVLVPPRSAFAIAAMFAALVAAISAVGAHAATDPVPPSPLGTVLNAVTGAAKGAQPSAAPPAPDNAAQNAAQSAARKPSTAATDAPDAGRLPDGTLPIPPLARVTDTAGALGAEGKRLLDDKLAAFELAHGSQIAIIVVPSTKPEPIADFTNRVGDAWKIGRKGVGDGVLITVAVQDRRIWISVARALEGALPDVIATRISREVIAPHFKSADYAGGLAAGLDAIFAQIDGEALPLPDRSGARAGAGSNGGDSALGLLFPFLIGGAVIGIGLRRVLGVPGSLLAGGGAGALAGFLLTSAVLGGVVGLVVLFISLIGGSSIGSVLGGRRGGGMFIPGGWSGGGGFGSGGGGFSSGGGGDFSGGGGGSSW